MARHMTFHVGEFARMTGVNKRTLHYYDSEGIFSPDSVEPNGYRAYSSRQFYPFYMIRMFRDMGLDLSEIKEYMQGRTPEKFARLLAEQEEWLEQEMAKLKRMRQIVANQRQLLAKAQEVRLDEVEEQEFADCRLVVSENLRQLCLREDWEGVERQFATHLRDVMEGEVLTGYTFGAMVSPQDFMRPGHEQVVSSLGTTNFTVELPANSSKSMSLQVEWQFNGEMGGPNGRMELPVIECGGTINVTR